MPIIPEKKDRPALLPVRHPEADFFICGVLDAPVKDDVASMEHPMFSLATKPDRRIRVYEHNGNTLQITPSVLGLATIFDKDVLIYCVSQLMAAINRGEEVSRTLHIQAYDLLAATNRRTDGPAYRRLVETMDRLQGTNLKTTIETNGVEQTRGFSIIDEWDIVKKRRDGRMLSMSVTLSRWLFNAVLGKEVLTISEAYFRLRKPIERRIYELARKHCGAKDEFKIRVELLHKKVGATGTLRQFRLAVRELVQQDHLPDYSVRLDGGFVVFRRRPDAAVQIAGNLGLPPLSPRAFEEAKPYAVRCGDDVYQWEQDWRAWWAETGQKTVVNADRAFVGWCRKRAAGRTRRN